MLVAQAGLEPALQRAKNVCPALDDRAMAEAAETRTRTTPSSDVLTAFKAAYRSFGSLHFCDPARTRTRTSSVEIWGAIQLRSRGHCYPGWTRTTISWPRTRHPAVRRPDNAAERGGTEPLALASTSRFPSGPLHHQGSLSIIKCLRGGWRTRVELVSPDPQSGTLDQLS